MVWFTKASEVALWRTDQRTIGRESEKQIGRLWHLRGVLMDLDNAVGGGSSEKWSDTGPALNVELP